MIKKVTKPLLLLSYLLLVFDAIACGEVIDPLSSIDCLHDASISIDRGYSNLLICNTLVFLGLPINTDAGGVMLNNASGLQPPIISYQTPQIYTVLTAISPLVPKNTGGSASSYSIEPALPTGLIFDTTTGIISGTPKTGNQAQDFTVVAKNNAGSSTTTVNIKVNYNRKVIFPPIPVKLSTDPDFDPGATWADGATPDYRSTDESVATIVDGKVHIINIGKCFIYTYQYTNVDSNSVLIQQPLLVVVDGGSITANPTVSIVPKNGPLLFKLNAEGTRNIDLSDIATVTTNSPVGADVIITPSLFNCVGTGIHTVTVKAKVVSSGSPSAVSFKYPSSLVKDASGNIYITDSQNSTIRKISSDGTVSTFAGSTSGYFDYKGEGANFNLPIGITIDVSGNLFVADCGNNRIRKITKDGDVTTFVGDGASYDQDGVGTAASLFAPSCITIDKAGNLYVCDAGKKIRKITPDAHVTTLAGGNDFGYADGQGVDALFFNPEGIVADDAGNLYVADAGNNRIRKITPGGKVTTYAGSDKVTGDGPVLSAGFNNPAGIAIDGNGNIYVGEYTGNRIRKISVDGMVITVAGNGSVRPVLDGPGKTATFFGVTGIVVDAAGNLIVADVANSLIRKVSSSGYVTTYAGSGMQGRDNGNIISGDTISATAKITVNITNTLAITIGTGDMHLPVNTICPSVLPDYTKLATYADNCSNKVTFTQTPAAGTPITGTDPFMVTIAATDDLGTTDSKSFKVIPDHKPLSPVTLTISTTVTTICDGSTVKFTASSNYAGATPSYQWHVNGGDVGDSQPVFTTNTLKNSDVVSCTLMSSAGCQISVPSNSVTMSVNPNITPTVSIVATSNDICAGYNDIFTATAQNAGSAPSYKWLLNGGEVSIGANGASYQNNSLANGDKVSCVVTNNDNICLTTRTATSAEITIVVSPMVTPAVSISSSAPSVVCIGTEITFTATSFNAAGAGYEWHVNGMNVGSNSPVYKTNILADGDVVTCTMQVSGKCLVVNSVIANSLTVHLSAAIKPGVSIAPQTVDVCAGTPVTFNANVDNNLTGITYQWQINGVNNGGNSGRFTINSLNDGDVVMCIVTGNSGCVLPAQSLPVTVHINPLPTVAFNQNLVVKRGSGVTLTPIITGNIKSYNWTPSVGLSNTTIANPIASPQATTTYNLQVITLSDCPVIVPVTVSVITPIDIPNTFTPNNDGVNDTWSIASLQYYNNCTVDVFNRYGIEVFHSAGYIKPWDGTFKGQGLPTGTYYYLIDLKNNMKKLAGAVTIIR